MRFYLFILFFLSIKVQAQIRLKQHNFVSVGDTIVEYYNRLPKRNIDVGVQGENITWDFSDLDATVVNQNTLQFIDPKDTPFSQDYPDANIALYSKDIYESWIFMNKSKKELKTLGSAVFVNKEKRLANISAGTIKFPIKYLDESISNTISERVFVKSKSGGDSIKLKTNYKHKRLIDSWGDVLLPKGTFLGLRMKYTLEVTNSFYQNVNDKWIPFGSPETDTTISYSWWTDDKNAKYPIAQVVMDEAHEKPIVIQYLEAIPFEEIINETEEKNVKIYPNPAKEKINLDLNTTEESYITIFTITGKIVKSVKANASKVTINISNLPVGIYFVVIRNEGGEVVAKEKFIKG